MKQVGHGALNNTIEGQGIFSGNVWLSICSLVIKKDSANGADSTTINAKCNKYKDFTVKESIKEV